MKKTSWILAANIALAVGTSGLYGYGKWKESRIHEAHEREVQQMVDHFKSCPDAYRDYGECYGQAERQRMEAAALAHRDAGRYLEAGMAYARLGRDFEDQAREMAGRCDDAGRMAIIRQIELRQEAGHRAGLR